MSKSEAAERARNAAPRAIPRRNPGRTLTSRWGSRLLLPVLALLAAACAGPGTPRGASRSTDEETTPLPVAQPTRPASASTATASPAGTSGRAAFPRRSGRVPAWAGKPLSAEKLETLAAWVGGEGLGYDDYWLVEGQLELAEGRAQLTRGTAQASFATEEARRGFELVHGHAGATEAQRQRAALGLQTLEGAGAGAPTTGALPGGVLSRTSWGAAPANPRLMDPAADPWRWITVHHSAMPGGGPTDGSPAITSHALQEIQTAHMNGEGYGDIGYHFLIDGAGRVYAGRDMRYQGAHAGHDANRGNIGICLLGNFEEERPTGAALASLDALIAQLSATYDIPAKRVKPHRYWKSTACPGRYLLQYVEQKYR